MFYCAALFVLVLLSGYYLADQIILNFVGIGCCCKGTVGLRLSCSSQDAL